VDAAPDHALCCVLMYNAVIAGLGAIRTDDSYLLELAYLVKGEMLV